MGKSLKRISRRFPVFIGCLLAFAASSAANASLYVYQAPDGSWMFTDHEVRGRHYRLVRKTDRTRGAAVAARQSEASHQGDPSAYDRLIKKMARAYGVDPALIKAIMRAESAFNPYARSRKGASGLMQLMPTTAEKYGVDDIYDPVQNIRAAVRYLSDLIQRFGNKTRLVLAAYNAGESVVAQHKGVPPYKETRDYVKKVLQYRRHYSRKF